MVVGAALLVASATTASLPGSWARAAGDPDAAAPVLQVVTAGGEVLVRAALGADATWEIAWLHSVAQVVVRDAFAWRDGRMWITDQRTPFLDIAGLGHIPGRGEVRDDGAGGYWIADIDQRLVDDVHRFIIGSVHAPTTLWVGGRSYDLSASHPGVRARIEVSVP